MKTYYYLIDGLTAIVRTQFKKPKSKNDRSEEFNKWRNEIDGLERIQLTDDFIEYINDKSDWDELIEGKDFVLKTFATIP
jgi:hypothetical protein